MKNREKSDDADAIDLSGSIRNGGAQIRNIGKRQAYGDIGGAYSLKRAWLFNGDFWDEIADMSVIR